MTTPLNGLYKTLKGMGIGTGKGSKNWRAGFEKVLNDNNIKSAEDISALTRHIEDKFNAARSGGTHEDGRFAGIMSYEGLGGNIWNRGVRDRQKVNLKRTPEQQQIKGFVSKFNQSIKDIRANNKKIVQSAIDDTRQEEYHSRFYNSSAILNSNKDVAKRVRDQEQRLRIEAGNDPRIYAAAAREERILREDLSFGMDAQDKYQDGLSQTMGGKDRLEGVYDSRRRGVASDLANEQGWQEQTAKDMQAAAEEKSRAYWNDEDIANSYRKDYANAQKQLYEKGEVDSDNAFIKLLNNEEETKQLQKYNPKLYQELGFGQKTLEEDLAEQEAYQAHFEVPNAIKEVREESPEFMGGGINRFSAEEAKIQAQKEAAQQELYNSPTGQYKLNKIGINEQALRAETERIEDIVKLPKVQKENAEIGTAATKKVAEEEKDLVKEVGGLDPYFSNTQSNDFGINTGFNDSAFEDLISQNTKGMGKKNAAKHALNRIKGDYQDNINSILADKSLTDIQRAEALAKARADAVSNAQQGGRFDDYIFGNKVHTGAIGVAALTATYGVAFGGHKSNAELYGSPF